MINDLGSCYNNDMIPEKDIIKIEPDTKEVMILSDEEEIEIIKRYRGLEKKLKNMILRALFIKEWWDDE